MRLSIDLPPGVVATPTKAKDTAYWRETNLVRWDNGVMLPFGGWEESSLSLVDTSENIRYIHAWTDNSHRRWVAYLTETKVYVESAGVLYDISPTPALTPPDYSNTSEGGFGDGPYGDDLYGTPRDEGPLRNFIGPCFKMDNWGENLIVMSSGDGRLLEWAPVIPVAGACAEVENSPTGRTFVITPERHIMVFQSGGDPGKWAWCDEEDNTNWTVDTTTKAGFYNVEPGGPIIAAINTPNGNLLWTDKSVTNSRYIGLPYIYSKDSIGTMSTPVSAASVAKTDTGAIWFTEAGVFQFNGVSVEPLPCPVWAWVLRNVDWPSARIHAFCVDLATKSELMFFFPSEEGSGNDRYIVFNYDAGWWAMGKMSRSAGFSANYIDFPVMADGNKIFVHDRVSTYPGAEDLPWAETFVLNINQGSMLSTLRHVEPEVEGDYDDLRFKLAYSTTRTPSNEKLSSARSVQSSGMVEFMVSGRDFRIRVESVDPMGGDWTIGPIIVDIVNRGSKQN